MNLEEIHEREWAVIVAALTRRFRSIDVAEEAAADAFAAAVERWSDGPPPNPGGWLMTTATRRAIDRLRRETVGAEKHAMVADRDIDWEFDVPDEELTVDDDRLRLIFTCCHPALAPEAQIALTLRMLGGLSVEQIARGLLKSEAAVGQRITRAKAKIASAHIPYEVPTGEELPARVDAVLTVLYLIFNEGHAGTASLSTEAIRLSRLVCALLPGDGEATGLLALMLMNRARQASRVSADGVLVTLADQDRSGWDRDLIEEGHALVRARIATGQAPGRYQLQAAIAAVHTYATDFRDTDWSQLDVLYRQLAAIDPSPVVALNRAVVVAELDGPAVALASVDALELAEYVPWHATRAELLRRLGRSAEAASAYAEATARSGTDAERRHLQRRRDSLAL